MIRQNTIIGIVFLIILSCGNSSYAQEKTSIRKIVIDAGHGGKDPGALGRKAKEKNITLAIALKLGKMIRENMPDVDVIYTRDSDVFVELYHRAEIANQSKADLFISVHCNANPSKSMQGAETYIMGLHKSKQNLEISKLENASILMEPDYLARYDGFDPGSDESYITFSLYQDAFLNQSMEFAAEVQNEMKDRVGLDDRGVRQAGFLVLYKTTMPSVLIETGFLSNPVEESYLLSTTGQEHIAGAICRALNNYKKRLEKNQVQFVYKDKDKDEDRKNEVVSKKELNPQRQDKKSFKDTTVIIAKNQEARPEKKMVKKDSVILPKKDIQEKSISKTNAATPPQIEIWYSVQIATYPEDIGVKNVKFKGVKDIKMYKHQGMYKYIVGKDTDPAITFARIKELKKVGFTDAFIVAFNGEERISVEEAKVLRSKQKGK
jgi:N-acetylmuramoyl-L-alanine amidase